MARRDRRPLGACRVIFWCRSSGWPPPTSLRHPHRYRRSCRGQHHRRCHGDGNRSEAQRVVEQQPQSEQQEQQASQDLQQPLRKAPVQQQPCADRQAVGQDHAQGGADPYAGPVVIAGQGHRRQRCLVTQLSQCERRDHGEQRESGFGSGWRGFAVAGRVLPPDPHGKDQECDRRYAGGRPGRHGRAQKVADRHRYPVHRERCDRHPGQHHPPAVAKCVGHRDELGSVAELSKENGSQT